MALTKTYKNRLKKKIKGALPEDAQTIPRDQLLRLSEGTPMFELQPILRELGVYIAGPNGTPAPEPAPAPVSPANTGATLDVTTPPDPGADPRGGLPEDDDEGDDLLPGFGGGEDTSSPAIAGSPFLSAPRDPEPAPREWPQRVKDTPALPSEFVRRQIAAGRIFKTLDSLSNEEDVQRAFVLTTLGQLERERAALRQWIEALGGEWPKGGPA